MPAVILCVRKPGKLEIDYSLMFSVPEVPKVGNYISVSKLDVREPLGEDYIVRKIWWRLRGAGDAEGVGTLIEIFVECDIACGPYATREWQQIVRSERSRGVSVEDFEVSRNIVGLGNNLPDDGP